MNMILEAIWDEFLKIVRQEAGSRVVETWLKAVTLNHWDALQKIIYLKAPNVFVKDWITSNYLTLFQIHLSRLLNVNTLKIIFVEVGNEEIKKEKTELIPAISLEKPQTANLIKKPHKKKVYLNQNYLFNTFVIGPSNQLAYAAAHAVTEQLGTLYNPLFIYGESGLGKTHLLHAIANDIKVKYKKVGVLYQTADRFVNEFINAIRFNKMPQFQNKYKTIDLLLIDDVQFISNKEQTQEAFFHIFNNLYEAQKQIVFSSDSYPADIKGLAERIRSRLSGGLITDIQAPTIETKIAILKRKADNNGEVLPDEVAYFIASRVVSNIRELEGALIRIMAFSSLTHQPITLELAKKVLYRNREMKKNQIDFNRIIECLQNHYSYSLTELRSQSRSKQLSLVRQIAMYLMKKMTNKSLQEIGIYLGRKDHSTVLYALNKVKRNVEKDPIFNNRMKYIEKEIMN